MSVCGRAKSQPLEIAADGALGAAQFGGELVERRVLVEVDGRHRRTAPPRPIRVGHLAD